jgi:putative hydrolase of HD superfamily
MSRARQHQSGPGAAARRAGATAAALLALEGLPRSGWIQAGIRNPESVAAHALGVAALVLLLGPRVRPALDLDRAVALAVVHDFPECLTTDLPRAASRLLGARAKHALDRAAAQELLAAHPAALARWREAAGRGTREARFAALVDKLQLGLRARSYARAGTRGARGLGEFRAGLAALDCAEFPELAAFRRELLRGWAADRAR